MKKDEPNLNVEKVPEGYIFESCSPLGETPRQYTHPYKNIYIAELKNDIEQIKMDCARDKEVLELLLKALGVETKNSMTPMYLLVQTLFNAYIIPHDKERFGFELDTMSGYIKKVVKIDGVLDELPEYPEFMHYVNGELVFDEERFNAVRSAE